MWPPQLKFFEARLKTMSRLDHEFGLAGFRIQEDRIEALVRNVGEVTVGPDRLRIAVMSPAYDIDRFNECIRIALEPFEPDNCVTFLRFQTLQAFDVEYAPAQAKAIDGWLTRVPGVVPGDAAVLFDALDIESEMPFQVEYGVVSRAEIPARLRRSVGRTRTPEDKQQTGLDVDTADLPAVATFADFRWSNSLSGKGLTSDVVLQVASTALARTMSIAGEIHKLALDASAISR
jgi:hypothetical protein